MKKTLLIVATTTIVTVLFGMLYSNQETNAKAVTLPPSVIKIVQDKVKTYKEDTGFKGQCKIDGKSFTLEAVVMGKISNESTYGTKGLGAKHNNRGNIKLAQKHKLPKQQDRRCTKENPTDCTVQGDGGRYFSYSTVAKGLYDVAERAKRRDNGGCNITYASVRNYVKGTKYPPKEDKAIRRYLNNMIEIANAYDNNKQIYMVDDATTRANSDMIHGKKPTETETTQCRPLKTIKNQFLQIEESGKTRQIPISPDAKAFNCQSK